MSLILVSTGYSFLLQQGWCPLMKFLQDFAFLGSATNIQPTLVFSNHLLCSPRMVFIVCNSLIKYSATLESLKQQCCCSCTSASIAYEMLSISVATNNISWPTDSCFGPYRVRILDTQHCFYYLKVNYNNIGNH